MIHFKSIYTLFTVTSVVVTLAACISLKEKQDFFFHLEGFPIFFFLKIFHNLFFFFLLNTNVILSWGLSSAPYIFLSNPPPPSFFEHRLMSPLLPTNSILFWKKIKLKCNFYSCLSDKGGGGRKKFTMPRHVRPGLSKSNAIFRG